MGRWILREGLLGGVYLLGEGGHIFGGFNFVDLGSGYLSFVLDQSRLGSVGSDLVSLRKGLVRLVEGLGLIVSKGLILRG